MSRRLLSVSLLACALLVTGCGRSALPASFPNDFPVPPGRVIVIDEKSPGKVQVVVESSLAVSDVPGWYEKQLAGKAWKPVRQGPMFATSEDFVGASLSDGSRTMDVVVTDIGSTTKVSLSASKP